MDKETQIEAALDKTTRRTFISRAAVVAAGTAGLFKLADACDPANPQKRRVSARNLRNRAAQTAFLRSPSPHTCNGEENLYATRIGNFSKAMPHNNLGEVDQAAYNRYLQVLNNGAFAGFETITLGGARKLTNPQCGMAFDLEGMDGHCYGIPPAPRINSSQRGSEYAECNWMALLRDLPFDQWQGDPNIAAAAADLSNFTDFRGPKQSGAVTVNTLFRGSTAGDLNGPYVSQFLWKPVPYGSLTIDQRQQTTMPGIDFLQDYNSWLAVQNGAVVAGDVIDNTGRYIRSMRDLCHYVHVDALYEAYLNACLFLLSIGTPVDQGNPYAASATQIGFGTYGGPHILSLVCEVATRALKAIWYQKWFVHRNLRPEAFGGLVHNRITGAASYPIHQELLNSAAMSRLFSQNGTYLLPMAFPEGCPTHPSYGSGHATVGGACVTILKAWFEESHVIPDPVVANSDGTALLPYSGQPLTVGGELNKVCANIASGRNMAGVHWRSDFEESVKLGEQIAIDILTESIQACNEPAQFSLTKFDGTTIQIR